MIGIVICNFNKKDYIINCIKSVLDQDFQDFDLYVVDNASTDGSAEAIRKEFPKSRVRLIENPANLGGSGGFNTGLRECLKGDYDYLMCVDNDIIMSQDNVGQLFRFMEGHPEIGMAGSKIRLMDFPELLQSFGCTIDFEKFNFFDHHKRENEDEAGLPEFEYCTFVPACSLIVRTETVRQIGIMPEDNFIYWDDMEWGYLANKAGWKVAVYRDAQIRHKTGGVSTNTFARYYLWRNRIRFFGKYLPKERYNDFSIAVINELFRMIYASYLKGDTNTAQSLMFALSDGMNNISGMAGPGRIVNRNGRNRMQEAENSGRKMVECPHVFEYGKPYNNEIVYDSFLNVIASEEDYFYCRSYEMARRAFMSASLPVMVDSLERNFHNL